jgi:hypothetical protein
MFLQISEPHLLQRQFEKVYMKSNNGKYSTFYYKRGIYLHFFYCGYYDVYSNEMHLIATVNNFYRLEILMIAIGDSLSMN